MEAVDVVCPRCDAGIGLPCRNPQGGMLGNQGTRQVAAKHLDRWDRLAQYTTELESSSQGLLKARLRDESQAIESLKRERPHMVADVAKNELLLKSRRRRYGYIFQLLDPSNRPEVKRYTKPPEKADVPHPELIDCPRPDCDAKKGSPCFPVPETKGYDRLSLFHLLRIQRSP